MREHETNQTLYDVSVKRLRSWLWCVYVCHYALLGWAIWGFLWGVWILGARLMHQEDPLWLFSPGLGVVPIIGVAIFAARKRIPDVTKLTALMDGYSRSGGLVMASDEMDTSAWQNRLVTCQSPRVQWQARRPVWMSVLSMSLVLLALLIPSRFMTAVTAQGMEVDPLLEDIREQIEVLAEEEIVTAVEEQELEDQVKAVRERAETGQMAQTWEALDHLQDKLNQQAAEAAQAMLQETERSSQIESLAQALNMGMSFDDQIQAGAMEALSKMLAQKLAQDPNMSGLDPELLKQIEQALDAGELSSQDLGALCGQMCLSKAQMKQCLMNLHAVRLIDAGKLAQCDKLCQCNGEGLAEFLAGAGAICDFNEVVACCGVGMMPCRGGINRGPGPAPMMFAPTTTEDHVAFQEQVLPPSVQPDLENAQTMGVSIADPTVAAEDRQIGVSGALAGASDSGSATVSHRILPRHQRTVQRYFSRQQSASSGNAHENQ